MTREYFTAALETLGNTVDMARYLERLDEILAHDTEQRALIEQQAKEVARLTDLRIRYGPICVVCGAAEPCDLRDDQYSPCSFDPAPKELYVKCKEQAKEIAELREALGKLMAES